MIFGEVLGITQRLHDIGSVMDPEVKRQRLENLLDDLKQMDGKDVHVEQFISTVEEQLDL